VDRAVERARPLLEAFSRGISVVGTEPKQAYGVKLGGSFVVSAMIHALGEALDFASGQGIEPQTFLETVDYALFQSPLYAEYSRLMLDSSEHAANIDPGAKDLSLLRQAAASRHIRLSLADHIAEILISSPKQKAKVV